MKNQILKVASKLGKIAEVLEAYCVKDDPMFIHIDSIVHRAANEALSTTEFVDKTPLKKAKSLAFSALDSCKCNDTEAAWLAEHRKDLEKVYAIDFLKFFGDDQQIVDQTEEARKEDKKIVKQTKIAVNETRIDEKVNPEKAPSVIASWTTVRVLVRRGNTDIRKVEKLIKDELGIFPVGNAYPIGVSYQVEKDVLNKMEQLVSKNFGQDVEVGDVGRNFHAFESTNASVKTADGADFVTKVVTEGQCTYFYSYTERGEPEVDEEGEEISEGEEYETWTDSPEDASECREDELQDAINGDYEDLAQYIHDDKLKEVVTKMDTPKVVSTSGGKFKLLWVVHSSAPLDKALQDKLIDYIDGQCSDGWGEGFEQREYYKDQTEQHFASPWFHEGRTPTKVIDSEDELDRQDVPRANPSGVKYPDIKVKLVGEDGNAFAIMGRVVQSLRRAKVSKEEIDEFQKDCMSGDYDHLLQTVMKWVEVA